MSMAIQDTDKYQVDTILVVGLPLWAFLFCKQRLVLVLHMKIFPLLKIKFASCVKAGFGFSRKGGGGRLFLGRCRV